MKYVAGLCLGFALGLIFVNLILGEHSQQYKKGFEAGKNWVPDSMTRVDSLMNQAKISPDSVEILIRNIYGKQVIRAFKVTGIIREE